MTQSRPQGIDFRNTRRFWCKSCKQWVVVIPCPACTARKGLGAGMRSALVGQRDAGPRRRVDAKRVTVPRDGLVASLFEIPRDILKWLHARLATMIGSEGRHADVAESAADLSRQFAEIITAQANVLGEERREKWIKKLIRKKG